MPQHKTYTVDEAKRTLENYCAYQERCHKEVVDKLQQMHMIPQAIDVIVSHLIENNYLNETRFAEAFVRGKFRLKKWGKHRLKRELKQRDISTYNITKALAQISGVEYYETFHVLASKRLNTIKETNTWKKRKKLADYLLYRGWESHLVYEKVNELIP
ncbi:regulatory protein RecX [Mangrovimonas spongiae]|uniref:Regulatory protein RecX n=1 Tax=Mangrovimonas spongiae TaxID=2494697 RepID=A0A428K5N1_9FLAO|nr:regulatory protein RecX [Mangrovimonas spongiae]RSK41682.1 RecX family transcriptional regulator [Mangrovimonas spongiae]